MAPGDIAAGTAGGVTATGEGQYHITLQNMYQEAGNLGRMLANLPGRGNKSASAVTDTEVKVDPRRERISYSWHQKYQQRGKSTKSSQSPR